MEEEEVVIGVKGRMELVEVVGGYFRSKGCAKIVRRMWLFSFVSIVSYYWFFVIIVFLCYIGG